MTAALTAEQLAEIEAAARYGIDSGRSFFAESCEPPPCKASTADPGCALLTVPSREVYRAEYGLWARSWTSEVIGGDEVGNAVLRVRARDDRPTEPEGWQKGDVVLDAAGSIWMWVGDPDWPWASGAASVTYYPEGSAEDARPPRPLVLLVRDGKPVAAGGAR